MKKSAKKLAAITASGFVLFSTLTVNAHAATSASKTAASFGIKYYASETATSYDDFRTNAQNAQKAYASISDIGDKSVKYSPTKSMLTSKIDETVVFLNNHGNAHKMTFRFFDNSGTYTVSGVTDTSTASEYVNISSMDLSNVKLISFVGCETALGSSNLTKTAVKQGASAAIGFDEEIASRSTEGKKWLETYNDSLAKGDNVWVATGKAIKASSSDLSQKLVIEGDDQVTIASSTSRSNEMTDGTAINIPLNLVLNEDKLRVSDDDINKITEEIIRIDPSFNISDYRISQNICYAKKEKGFVKYDYFIDDLIQTNRSYVVFIEEGVANRIVYTLAEDFKAKATETAVNEAELIHLCKNFNPPATIADFNSIDERNVEKYSVEYFYDYDTKTLTYLETLFYANEPEGEIIDLMNEVVIYKGE